MPNSEFLNSLSKITPEVFINFFKACGNSRRKSGNSVEQ
jgi:hypothetical protein